MDRFLKHCYKFTMLICSSVLFHSCVFGLSHDSEIRCHRKLSGTQSSLWRISELKFTNQVCNFCRFEISRSVITVYHGLPFSGLGLHFLLRAGVEIFGFRWITCHRLVPDLAVSNNLSRLCCILTIGSIVFAENWLFRFQVIRFA